MLQFVQFLLVTRMGATTSKLCLLNRKSEDSLFPFSKIIYFSLFGLIFSSSNYLQLFFFFLISQDSNCRHLCLHSVNFRIPKKLSLFLTEQTSRDSQLVKVQSYVLEWILIQIMALHTLFQSCRHFRTNHLELGMHHHEIH